MDCERIEVMNMLRVLKWVLLTLAGLFLALLAALAVLSIFRFGMMPIMARDFRGPFLYYGFRYAPWVFLLGRLLLPLALIVLLILAGFVIGRGLSGPRAPVAATTCHNCGRPVQADWNICPYCGAKLKSDEPIMSPGENIS